MQRITILLMLALMSVSAVLPAKGGPKPAVLLDLRFDKGDKPEFVKLNGAAG